MCTHHWVQRVCMKAINTRSVMRIVTSIERVRCTMTTNNMHMMVCFIGGVTCLLPLLISPTSYLENTPLRLAITSVKNTDSAVAAISLLCPLTLDLLTEIYNTFITKGKRVEDSCRCDEVILNSAERCVFLLGTVLIPATAFFPTTTPNWAYVYMCCHNAQLSLVSGAVMISFCRRDKKYWTVCLTNAFLSLLILGTVTMAFADNCETTNLEKTQTRSIIAASGYYLVIAALAVFVYCCVTYLWDAIPMFVALPQSSTFRGTLQQPHVGDKTPRLISHAIYIMTSFMAVSLLIAVSVMYDDISNNTDDALLLRNGAFTVYLLFISYLSMRMMKYEMVQGVYSLIESKKTYVRYISHELRTPLNAACLGLKLLSEDMALSTDSKDMERCETLTDVKSACRTAVEILNDLLCFDKLESDALVLHKHDVAVLPFIEECVQMFSSQARESGINMYVVPPIIDPLSPSQHTLILDSDMVFMDKFKMDQVLRNLLSNALKFTPRGGSVTLRASFVPDDDIPSLLRNESEGRSVERSGNINSKIASYFKRFIALFRRCPVRATGPDLEAGVGAGIPGSGSTESILKVNATNSLSVGSSCSGMNELSEGLRYYDDNSKGQRHLRDTKLNMIDIMAVDTGNKSDPNDNINSKPDNITLDAPSSTYRKFTGGNDSDGVSDKSVSNNIFGSSFQEHNVIMKHRRSSAGNVLTSNEYITNDLTKTSSPTRNASDSISDTMYCTELGKLVIVVTDTGVGISSDNIKRLFKEVVQFNPEVLQAGGGSGLGLWITNSIVTMHSGTVSAYSAGVGTGSSFTMEIAMRRDRNPTPQMRAETAEPTTPNALSKSPSLLISPAAPPKWKDPEGKKDGGEKEGPLRQGMDEQWTEGDITGRAEGDEGGRDDAVGINGIEMLRDVILQESEGVVVQRRMPLLGALRALPGALKVEEVAAGDLLLVDDSSLNRKMLGKILRLAGYLCDEAYDGVSAVEMIKKRMMEVEADQEGGPGDGMQDGVGTGRVKKKNYDAILIDFVMPIMDGPTATSVIRSLGYTNPIFGVTGNTLDSDIEYFISMGANAVLPKPFDFMDFKKLMRDALMEAKETSKRKEAEIERRNPLKK